MLDARYKDCLHVEDEAFGLTDTVQEDQQQYIDYSGVCPASTADDPKCPRPAKL